MSPTKSIKYMSATDTYLRTLSTSMRVDAHPPRLATGHCLNTMAFFTMSEVKDPRTQKYPLEIPDTHSTNQRLKA